MKLHPETQILLNNIEKYLPPCPKEGYYAKTIGIIAMKKCKKGGYPYYFNTIKYLPLNQIKTGSFITILKLEPFPKIYKFAPMWHAISRRYGCGTIFGKDMFVFSYKNTEIGLKITTHTIKKA